MKSTQRAIGRAADRLMALDSGAYGDERERAVVLEASTFGYTLGLYVNLVLALVAAVLGGLLLPAVLLAVMAVPSWSAIWWAGRRDVDMSRLAERAAPGSKAAVALVVFGGMFLTLAAMAYIVLTGHGLVPTPEVDVVGPDAEGMGAGLVQGAVVGGMIGLLAAAVVTAVKQRRRGTPDVASEGLLDDDDLDD